MARYRFVEGNTYAARLQGVHERPIENSRVSRVRLLRLEFEVFLLRRREMQLSSTGMIACRDIVLGPAVDPSRDSSVMAYACALRLRNPSNVNEWLRLSGQPIWVTIVFGPKGATDMRNSFESISPFDVHDWQVKPYDYNVDEDWLAVAHAARLLKCSESTIRRRTGEFERVWGTELLRWTEGGHRRIYFPLLRNLWRE